MWCYDAIPTLARSRGEKRSLCDDRMFTSQGTDADSDTDTRQGTCFPSQPELFAFLHGLHLFC